MFRSSKMTKKGKEINIFKSLARSNVFSTKFEEQEVNLVWPNLCIFWLLFICLYRSWSWSLLNFVWMNISGYQIYFLFFEFCAKNVGASKWFKNVNFFSFFCLFVIFDERSVKYYNSLRNIRYPAEWTGVNVPVVFRMKIKISKSRLSLLISGIICLNLLKNKIFQIKINIFLIFFMYFQKRETIF
jgi:hypothetical protein